MLVIPEMMEESGFPEMPVLLARVGGTKSQVEAAFFESVRSVRP
jgi:hypothetical protein